MQEDKLPLLTLSLSLSLSLAINCWVFVGNRNWITVKAFSFPRSSSHLIIIIKKRKAKDDRNKKLESFFFLLYFLWYCLHYLHTLLKLSHTFFPLFQCYTFYRIINTHTHTRTHTQSKLFLSLSISCTRTHTHNHLSFDRPSSPRNLSL